MKKYSKLTLRYLMAAPILLLLISVANAKTNWIRIQTKNFTLVSDASESEVRKVALKLEQFRSALAVIFPKTRLDTPTPTTVLLFRSDEEFRPFKPRVKGKIQEEVGGYFLRRADVNYIVLAADNPAASTYEIIFHEYEHYVLHTNAQRLPVWLDEGLAEFFSSFEASDKEPKATLGDPIARHVFYLRDQSFMPLKTLLTVDRKSPYYNEGRKAGTFYAESWGLVHYLMLADEGKHLAQLQQFINSLSEDRPIEELFRRAFQTDLKPLEDQLKKYLSGRMFPVLNVGFTERLAVEKEMTTTNLPEAQTEYYLGDLFLKMNRTEDAEKRLKKSLALDPTLASSEALLGTLTAEKTPDEARKLFESAINHDPKNYLAHYWLGRMFLRDKKYDEAIKSYQQSVSLRPDLAFTYTGLGYAYLDAGRTDDAFRAFNDGLRLNPKDESFYHSLAYVSLQNGQGQLAVNYAVGYLHLQGWQDEHAPYLALVKYFGLRQVHRELDAQKALDEAIAQITNTAWPSPVFQYLKHSMTLTELLARAGTDNDQLTEAHAYAGLEFSLAGERELALEHLRWVREKGNKNFVEYPLALAEIGRLEKDASSH